MDLDHTHGYFIDLFMSPDPLAVNDYMTKRIQETTEDFDPSTIKPFFYFSDYEQYGHARFEYELGTSFDWYEFIKKEQGS
jgi:hypothetical protein